MFDALEEGYDFGLPDTLDLKSIQTLTVGYDTIMCALETQEKVEEVEVIEPEVAQPAEVEVEVPEVADEQPKVLEAVDPVVTSGPLPVHEKYSVNISGPISSAVYQSLALKTAIEKVNKESMKTYGYKGKNYNPNFYKEKYGDKYDPSLVKRRSLRVFAPREFEAKKFESSIIIHLEQQIQSPTRVIDRLTSKSKPVTPKPGYKGKNYDPSYLKNVLGPKERGFV